MTRDEEIAQYQRWRVNASKEMVRMRTALRLGYLAPSTAKKYEQVISKCEEKINQCNEALDRLGEQACRPK